MMFYGIQFLDNRCCNPNIQFFVKLAGITRDNFTVKMLCNLNSKTGFTNCSWAKNNNEGLFQGKDF